MHSIGMLDRASGKGLMAGTSIAFPEFFALELIAKNR